MSKPLIHAKNSARKFGGKWQDYIAIHDFIDMSKSAHATMKHRTVLHSALGIYIVERVFGTAITVQRTGPMPVGSSRSIDVAVRDIAEQHVLEDLGFIPSLDDYLKHMEEQPWMAGIRTRKMVIVD